MIDKFKLVEQKRTKKKKKTRSEKQIDIQLGVIKFARQTVPLSILRCIRSSTKLTRLPLFPWIDPIVFFHFHGAIRTGSAGGDQLLKHRQLLHKHVT